MSEKVFGVYLAKEDPESDAYAKLDLPAQPWELLDALDIGIFELLNPGSLSEITPKKIEGVISIVVTPPIALKALILSSISVSL